jgi:hypothetical protein
VQQAGLIAFSVVVGLMLIGSVLRRIGIDQGSWLSLFGGMLARVIAGVAFGWSAVRSAERGGIWFASLAVVLGFLAVADFVFLGLMTWGVVKYSPNPDT